MHGGTARGPKTQAGKDRARQAALRHGGHTKQAKARHREAMALIRQCKDILSVHTWSFRPPRFFSHYPSILISATTA